MSPLVGMFKIMGPTALRSIASNKVAKCDQSKLFAFISGSDGLLQLATSGKIYIFSVFVLHSICEKITFNIIFRSHHLRVRNKSVITHNCNMMIQQRKKNKKS